MKWISVEERMPEKNTHVLVFNPSTDEGWQVTIKGLDEKNVWRTFNDMYDKNATVEDDNYSSNLFLNDRIGGNITHWMPIPNVPIKLGTSITGGYFLYNHCIFVIKEITRDDIFFTLHSPVTKSQHIIRENKERFFNSVLLFPSHYELLEYYKHTPELLPQTVCDDNFVYVPISMGD